jgi:hypothetical protein
MEHKYADVRPAAAVIADLGARASRSQGAGVQR